MPVQQITKPRLGHEEVPEDGRKTGRFIEKNKRRVKGKPGNGARSSREVMGEWGGETKIER